VNFNDDQEELPKPENIPEKQQTRKKLHKRCNSSTTWKKSSPQKKPLSLKMLSDRYNEHLKTTLDNCEEAKRNSENFHENLEKFLSSYKEGLLSNSTNGLM